MVALVLVAASSRADPVAQCEARCYSTAAQCRLTKNCDDEMDMNCKCGDKMEACRRSCFKPADPQAECLQSCLVEHSTCGKHCLMEFGPNGCGAACNPRVFCAKSCGIAYRECANGCKPGRGR